MTGSVVPPKLANRLKWATGPVKYGFLSSQVLYLCFFRILVTRIIAINFFKEGGGRQLHRVADNYNLSATRHRTKSIFGTYLRSLVHNDQLKSNPIWLKKLSN